MNTFFPAKAQSNGSALKIKGRTMTYGILPERLRNLCATLGFTSLPRLEQESGKAGGVDELSWKWAEHGQAVIFVSCRVPYNPHWGEFGGYPNLFSRAGTVVEEESPAAFIAPFLQEYRFAQERILLARNSEGEYHVTFPAAVLQPEGRRLRLHLDRIAQADPEGHLIPVAAVGASRTYTLAAEFLQDLARQDFVWQEGLRVPIGRYLSAELFSFAGSDAADLQESILTATLFPHLREIVSHRNPNLRAAELHLGQLFGTAVAALTREYGAGNGLCLAGLDIDMSAAVGHEERHCFVPWRACLLQGGKAYFLEQDDLFVRLMQQNNG